MKNQTVYDGSGRALGFFGPGASEFTITSPELPAPWEYIYQNGDLLLKVDQFGPVYAQAHPPGDIVLFRREAGQRLSPWLVWLQPEGEPAFHALKLLSPDAFGQTGDDAEYSVRFCPDAAYYHFRHGTLEILTEFFLPAKGCEAVMRCTITNHADTDAHLFVRPHLIPYVNPAQLAPWDKYEWYLKTGLGTDRCAVFWSQLFDAASIAANRRTALLWTDAADLSGAEISLEKYIGFGSMERPQNALCGGYRMTALPQAAPGEYLPDNTLYAYPPVWAAEYDWHLRPGASRTLTQVLSMPGNGADGWFPEPERLRCAQRFFDAAVCEAARSESAERYARLRGQRRLETGDTQLDEYINDWLPMHLDWVCALDRGWPTGMRGSRDSAQDCAALLPLQPAKCRDILCTMLSCQRRDGWFPRQYSAKGRTGKHDLRTHVDAGVFFLEFIWMYAAYTGDLDIFAQSLPWLDDDTPASVLEHTITALDYYLLPENLGEHGLCKIRGGDWLDSLNRAGLEGRGESVMVTEQAVMGIWYVCDLLRKLGAHTERIPAYEAAGTRLADAVRRHGWDPAGWFRGVFTDGGAWVFSSSDPDGEARVYGPVNYYAVISGIAQGETRNAALHAADRLKGPCGYRLYSPYMGRKPIAYVGRAASGDSPAFMGENGNVYNHGSQGFLLRARAAAGDGDGVLDALKWILPYDQARHPTSAAMSAPYAIPNCWQELPVFYGRVMMTFLTGSVAMAARGAWEWLAGIRPMLDGLCVDPCIPRSLPVLQASCLIRGHRIRLTVRNESGTCCGVRRMMLDGRPAGQEKADPFSGRTLYCLPYALLRSGENRIEVWL